MNFRGAGGSTMCRAREDSVRTAAMRRLTLSILTCFAIVHYSDTATPEFSVPTNTGCICPDDELTFTCTAVGTGNTQWGGTAFDCPGNGFFLRHERFAGPRGVTAECNDGAIVGRSVGAENGCYTSQLRFTFTPSFNNKTVSCTYNSNVAVNIIGTSILTMLEAPFPPPNNVHLVDVSEGNLTFTWSLSLGSNCRSITYGIISDCGSCPTITNTPTAICSVNQLSRNASVCSFSIYSIICGNNGQMSEEVEATLKAPDVPLVKIVPLYSKEGSLLGFAPMINNQEAPFVIIDGLLGNVISYNFYFNSNKNPPSINASCISDNYSCMVNVPPFVCASTAYINITTSAVNVLGEGPRSDPTTIGCENNFVTINFNRNSASISCNFLDILDTSEKFCRVSYGLCDEAQTNLALSSNTTSSIATLNLNLSSSSHSYCYTLIASNATYEIRIEGRIDRLKDDSHAVTIVSVVIILAVIMMLIPFSVGALIYCIRRKQVSKDSGSLTEMHPTMPQKITDENIPYLHLQPVDLNESWITSYEVEYNCSLEEFLEKKSLVKKKGHVFYEFTGEIECIPNYKRLFFMKRGTNKYFFPVVELEELKNNLFGETVLKPSLQDYIVFIQSTGSGDRYLPAKSIVLYEQLQPHPLWHVDVQYKVKQLNIEYTLKDFCSSHELNLDECKIYLELGTHAVKDKLDVIVQDMDTGRLLTGPFAVTMAKKLLENPASVKEKQCNGAGINQNNVEKNEQCDSDSKGEHKTLVQEPTKEKSAIRPPATTKQLDDRSADGEMLESHFVKEALKKQSSIDNDLLSDAGEDQQGLSDNDEEEEQITDPVGDSSGSREVDVERWRLFVLMNECDENLKLEAGAWIVYQEQQSIGAPCIPIRSTQFKTKMLPKKSRLTSFQNQHDLNTGEDNVFVEIGPSWVSKSKVLDVILMDKETETDFFTGPSAWDEIKDSKNAQKQHQNKRRILALCRYRKWFSIPQGSWVLYRVNVNYNQPGHYNGLLPVYPEFLQFSDKPILKVDETLNDFCDHYDLKVDKYDFFLELDSYDVSSEDKPKDIILQDKRTSQLYTGPYAHQILKHSEEAKQDRWRVFVLNQAGEDLKLKDGFRVKCKLQGVSQRANFHVLKVEESNVRMSDFIKDKLQLSEFENGKAFYELTQSKELLYYKEVIHIKAELMENQKNPQEIECEVLPFYKISGAPRTISRPRKGKIFIQSTSQGSKCPKKGALLLYRKVIKGAVDVSTI